jgi:MYXO-CTERM domain-containing protein
MIDARTSEHDAATTNDAMSAGQIDAGEPPLHTSGGCGCSTGGRAPAPPPFTILLAFAFAALLIVRRR